MAELTDRLAVTVANALREHELSIERGAGKPRSLHVEISLGRDGGIAEVGFWVESRMAPSEMVGVGGSRRRRS